VFEFADGTRWDTAWFENWLVESGNGDDELSGTAGEVRPIGRHRRGNNQKVEGNDYLFDKVA
jgi:hypothetical protein